MEAERLTGRGVSIRSRESSLSVPFCVSPLHQLRGAGRAEAYNEASPTLQQFPLAVVWELLVSACHCSSTESTGSSWWRPSRPEPPAEPRAIGRSPWLQRVTGVVLFAFVLFHLWTARLVQIRDHENLDLFRLMQSALASP